MFFSFLVYEINYVDIRMGVPQIIRWGQRLHKYTTLIILATLNHTDSEASCLFLFKENAIDSRQTDGVTAEPVSLRSKHLSKGNV